MASEFDIIERYFLKAMMPDYVSVGPGDDCGVFSVPNGQNLCVSTDTLLEGVHFPVDAKPAVAASRSVGANLSDLAAMGAVPHAMTVALTLPRADEQWLESFSKTMFKLARQYECPIIGGNLAKGDLSITITVMGLNENPILRSGAKVGDDIYVSGFLGDAAGAVEQLGADKRSTKLLKRYEKPEPRVELGVKLRPYASAMIDISDGFLADLNHLVESSKSGAQLKLADLPLSKTLIRVFGKADARQLALFGGDDYELCFTANGSHREEIQSIAHELGFPITRVGQIVKEQGISNAEGQLMIVNGYEHF